MPRTQLGTLPSLSGAFKFDDWVSSAHNIDGFAFDVSNLCNIPQTFPTLPGGADLAKLVKNSPIHFVTANPRPLLMVTSTNDNTPVDQVDDMVAALNAVGALNFQTKVLTGNIHSWEQWPLIYSGSETVGQHALAFIQQALSDVGGGLTLVSAASSKRQGNAGTFDIDLPLTGTPGVECRVGNGGTFLQTIVFTFSEAVTSISGSTTTTCGSINSTTISGSTVTVELGHVNCDGSDITVTVLGVNGVPALSTLLLP